nr:MAG TPA: upper collar protein [Caudoviricetes sp.]
MDFNTIEQSFKEKIKQRVVSHRNRFYKLIYNRYAEILPLTISYENIDKRFKVDLIQLESMLRHNYNVAIGEDVTGDIVILGYVNLSNKNNFDYHYLPKTYTKKDINFIINEAYILPEYTQLNQYNKNGNFIVIQNKVYNYINDYEIIEHYAEEIAEISLSRFSLILQAKVMTFFRGDLNGDDLEEVIDNLFNGAPAIKTSVQFDVNENIIRFDNGNITSTLTELKREFQNKLSELNSMLGLSSLGVDKESGVSDEEAQSNASFKKSNENIYLFARNNALKFLNERYEMDIHAEFSENMVKELSSLEKLEMLSK